MNLHRAYNEILILAVAAVMVVLVGVAKAPEPQDVVSRASALISATVERAPADVHQAAVQVVPASLQTVSASPLPSASDSEWLRAESIQAPVKQTRWVF